jgi:hypothetical protein
MPTQYTVTSGVYTVRNTLICQHCTQYTHVPTQYIHVSTLYAVHSHVYTVPSQAHAPTLVSRVKTWLLSLVIVTSYCEIPVLCDDSSISFVLCRQYNKQQWRCAATQHILLYHVSLGCSCVWNAFCMNNSKPETVIGVICTVHTHDKMVVSFNIVFNSNIVSSRLYGQTSDALACYGPSLWSLLQCSKLKTIDYFYLHRRHICYQQRCYKIWCTFSRVCVSMFCSLFKFGRFAKG